MVALPKRWVKEMGLRQGSEIIITRPSVTSLLISADLIMPQESHKNEAIIDVADKENTDTLFRKIVSLYILGYKQVSIRGGVGVLSPAKRDAIKESVHKHLIGTEGVADSKDKITIHVLLGYSELSVDSALKKMLLIAASIYKDAITSLESHDKSLAEGVLQREDEVGRFGLYVIRQVNMSINQGIYKESILDLRDVLGYTLVARSLERIAYHSVSTARAVVELENWLPRSTSAKLLAAGEQASNLVEEALLSLFKRDHYGADAVVEKTKRFVENENELSRSFDGQNCNENYTLHLLVDSQKRIAEYARDIAETVLDLTIERVVKKDDQIYAKVS